MRSSNEPTHTRHRVSARHERRAAAHGSSSTAPVRWRSVRSRRDAPRSRDRRRPWTALRRTRRRGSRPARRREVARSERASTFASFQRRAPSAVAASPHSAARTPATLLAAIDAPVPVQQHTIPCAARPSATSRAAASDAHAQSSRSASLSAPCSSGSCPRRRTSSTTASATPVRSSAAIAIRMLQQARTAPARPPDHPESRHLATCGRAGARGRVAIVHLRFQGSGDLCDRRWHTAARGVQVRDDRHPGLGRRSREGVLFGEARLRTSTSIIAPATTSGSCS